MYVRLFVNCRVPTQARNVEKGLKHFVKGKCVFQSLTVLRWRYTMGKMLVSPENGLLYKYKDYWKSLQLVWLTNGWLVQCTKAILKALYALLWTSGWQVLVIFASLAWHKVTPCTAILATAKVSLYNFTTMSTLTFKATGVNATMLLAEQFGEPCCSVGHKVVRFHHKWKAGRADWWTLVSYQETMCVRVEGEAVCSWDETRRSTQYSHGLSVYGYKLGIGRSNAALDRQCDKLVW